MKLEEGIKENVSKHRISRMTAESAGPADCQSTKGTLKKGKTTAEITRESFHLCSLWRRSGRFPSSQGIRWKIIFLKKAINRRGFSTN